MIQNPGNRYKILIADDDPTIQRLLRDFLNNLGYEAASVMDGCRAITELEKNHYDLLLSDIVMPCMDGIELIKSVRSMDRYNNLPVILLSGKNDPVTKVNAFAALADDYVVKPFDFDELTARIQTQLRLKKLQEELEEKNRQLGHRNLELETHLDVARHFQQQILPLNTKDIYGLKIRSFYQPIDKVGGDIFDIVPFKNGRVGIFIGDVSGHGVPAVFLNIMLKMAFQTAVRDEIQPNKVLEKINSILQSFMHDENFITAIYAMFDTNNKLLYLASAGHPNGIIIRAGNKRIETINSKGICIGIMDNVSYEAKAVRLWPGDRIIFYTDGVIEIKNTKGGILGTEGLSDIAGRSSENNDMDKMLSRIVDEMYRFSTGKTFEDDITILCLEMLDSFQYSWPSGNLNIKDAVNTMIKPLTSILHCKMDTKEIKKVKVALSEAMSNALEHGNLGLHSFIMNEDLDDELFDKLKKELLANPAYSRKNVTVKYIIEGNKITYAIKDDGNGFDRSNIADPTSPENITKCNGRGISLIKMCMDHVSFNEKGNEIRMVKKLGSFLKKLE
ncbi:MAG: SpoIIE family protein phosphatase [Nitrospirae bacterium]|nr:SpoIIE family protein phosphatase [Nitrospirota bacterium]